MAGRVVVVIGACGTVGSGVVKLLLESSVRVVAVSRTDQSLADLRQKLGNPSKDKLVTVQGNLSSEESATELKEAILAKVGTITDVVASIGGFRMTGPILDQTLEEYRKMAQVYLETHYMAAKTFIPLLADQEGASYLAISGGTRPLTPQGVHTLLSSGKYDYIPNAGFINIFGTAKSKMIEVIFCEYEGKPIRINEFSIYGFIEPVEKAKPGEMNNMDMGRAVTSVITKGVARSQVIPVSKETLEKIVQDGKYN